MKRTHNVPASNQQDSGAKNAETQVQQSVDQAVVACDEAMRAALGRTEAAESVTRSKSMHDTVVYAERALATTLSSASEIETALAQALRQTEAAQASANEESQRQAEDAVIAAVASKKGPSID